MPTNTPRLSLLEPVGSDAPSEFRIADTTNMAILDQAVRVFQGTLTARAGVTPAYGDEYYATDTSQWFKWNGTTWLAVTHVFQGTLAAQSSLTPAFGDEYYATDTSQWFKWNGAVWRTMPMPGAGVSGATNITTSQSTSSTTYTTLATSDQVTGLVVPTNGLIEVLYQATWQESVAGAARAAIFIGATQQKVAVNGNAAPQSLAAETNAGLANLTTPLFSTAIGLMSANPAGTNYGPDVTTGQAVGGAIAGSGFSGDLQPSVGQFAPATPAIGGGPCYIFAAAGTYTISVQFKASSGSVTASNRRLYARVITY